MAEMREYLEIQIIYIAANNCVFVGKLLILSPFMTRSILFVALGGALGSVARFLLSRFLQGSIITAFPVGTMVVNILGCLLIGIFYGLADRNGMLDANMKLFLTVGFCGGFTTFSTFMNESLQLFRSDNILYGALYAGGSVFLGLVAVFMGLQIVKAI